MADSFRTKDWRIPSIASFATNIRQGACLARPYPRDMMPPLASSATRSKAKVAFLTTSQPASFPDVLLFASDDGSADTAEPLVPVPAHKAVLVSRSPVFKAMLENEMEESQSGTIKIGDVSYDALCAFVNYLYTAEICLDQQLAYYLLVMAEKYQVQHLKDYCQKFLVSNLNWDNVLPTYTFAHQHNSKPIIDAALRVITANMDKLTAREEYAELKERHPGLVLEIYEAHFSRAAAVIDQSSFSCVRRASLRSRGFPLSGRRQSGNQPQVSTASSTGLIVP